MNVFKKKLYSFFNPFLDQWLLKPSYHRTKSFIVNICVGQIPFPCTLFQAAEIEIRGCSSCGFQIDAIALRHWIEHTQRLFCAILKRHTIVAIMPSAFLQILNVANATHYSP